VKSNAPQGRRTPKRFREFRECCAYVPACGVRQPRCRFLNCRAFLWIAKAFGAGTTALQQSVTKGVSSRHSCLISALLDPGITDAGYNVGRASFAAGIGDPGSRRRFTKCRWCSRHGCRYRARGPDAVGKKRLAGEGAAVHSATQN